METTVTKRHIEILEHMLGDETHYRNYFATFEEGKDWDDLCEMEREGLVKRNEGVNKSIYGEMIFFYATGAGKRRAFKGFHNEK